MDDITSINQAKLAMTGFLIAPGSGLPADMLNKVQGLMAKPSPVDQICQTAEYLFANKADLNAAARNLCGGLAGLAAENFFQGMGDNDRGLKIRSAMMRDAGDAAPSGGWPAEADDPEPAAAFAPPVVNEAAVTVDATPTSAD